MADPTLHQILSQGHSVSVWDLQWTCTFSLALHFFSEIELACDESLALSALWPLVCGTVPHYSLQLALDPFFASYLWEQPRVSQLLCMRSFSTIFCTLMIRLYMTWPGHIPELKPCSVARPTTQFQSGFGQVVVLVWMWKLGFNLGQGAML